MEKVIYRNKQNGKIGTLVKNNLKFKQIILNVDGQNVPYSSATIKRWWEVVDGTQLNNTSETTSVSEAKVTTPTPDPIPKQSVKKSPETKSKKVSPTSKTKGPDMEVFSYIKEVAKNNNLEVVEMNRGWQVFRNSEGKKLLEARLGKKYMKVHTRNVKVPKKLYLTYDVIKGCVMCDSYTIDYDKDTLLNFINLFANL